MDGAVHVLYEPGDEVWVVNAEKVLTVFYVLPNGQLADITDPERKPPTDPVT